MPPQPEQENTKETAHCGNGSGKSSGKIGLVLEGGAMRGLFTAGVLDVFMEQGISFDGMVGVSAGACFGCNLKSGQIGRALRYNKKYCTDWRYCSIRSLVLTGNLFGAQFCYHRLPAELDPFDWEAFLSNPMEFFLVCTDMLTGEPVYHRCSERGYECLEWMRASASMPIVSTIVEINGGKYMDGAVADSIPLAFMERQGYGKNVVILTQPDGYVKQKQPFMGLVRLLYRKYPRFLDAFGQRHLLYNRQLECVQRQAEDGKAFVIRPEATLPVKRITSKPELLQQTYDIGRLAGEQTLSKLKRWMEALPL